MSKITIDKTNLDCYIGHEVINEDGHSGQIVEIYLPLEEYRYPLHVRFDNCGSFRTYTIDGYMYIDDNSQFIELVGSRILESNIEAFLTNNKISAEKLIALLLEKYC